MRQLPICAGLFFLFTCFWLFSCNPSVSEQQDSSVLPDSLKTAQCIKEVFALDDSLGSVRNHACESIPLSETIINYTTALKSLNYQQCPKAFAQAFNTHWKAWDEMIPVVNKYPDLRGEMHDLFDQIEKGPDSSTFKIKLKAIWDTWAIVEQSSN